MKTNLTKMDTLLSLLYPPNNTEYLLKGFDISINNAVQMLCKCLYLYLCVTSVKQYFSMLV